MVVGLLLRHVDIVLKVLWVWNRLLFQRLLNGRLVVRILLYLFIWNDLVGEKSFVNESIEHSGTKDAGEELLILLGTFAWENTNKVSAAVVFVDCLVAKVSELEQGCTFATFVDLPKLFVVLLTYSF